MAQLPLILRDRRATSAHSSPRTCTSARNPANRPACAGPGNRDGEGSEGRCHWQLRFWHWHVPRFLPPQPQTPMEAPPPEPILGAGDSSGHIELEEEEERDFIKDLKRHGRLAVAWNRHGVAGQCGTCHLRVRCFYVTMSALWFNPERRLGSGSPRRKCLGMCRRVTNEGERARQSQRQRSPSPCRINTKSKHQTTAQTLPEGEGRRREASGSSLIEGLKRHTQLAVAWRRPSRSGGSTFHPKTAFRLIFRAQDHFHT